MKQNSLQTLKQIKNYISMVSPFNNNEDIPVFPYVIKKLIAFLFIYFASGIIGEIFVISGLMIAGYDPINGIMPGLNALTLIKYYGFFIHLCCAIMYCKLIEKRNLNSIGFNKSIGSFGLGGIIAIILLTIIIGICTFTNTLTYDGISRNINYTFIITLFGGLIIQSTAEEVLCRGFLMQSLLKKVPVWITIFISSTAFAFPHFSSLFESEFRFAVLGVINLYLISIVFSLLILCKSNIWISCGLHCMWNFLLYGILGLTLSGSNTTCSGPLSFKVNG